MAQSDAVRQYIVFNAEQLLGRPIQASLERIEVEQALLGLLGPGISFTIESLPAASFMPYETMELPRIPQSIAVLLSPDESEARSLRQSVESLIAREGPVRVSGIGVDPNIGVGDFSFPGSLDDGLFGTRQDAHRLLGIDRIPAALNLTGHGVNVVVVDAGLDSSILPAGQWGGGWQLLPGGPVPGTTTGQDGLHAMMIVHNILAVAPQARIWDVPLIPPPRINDLGTFLSNAQAVFDSMIGTIELIQNLPGPPQQWVFVNAWAIYDRRSEAPLFGDYTENQTGGPLSHPFIQRIEHLAADGFDAVFCAGNCGGVCPDGRCGPNDYGPGRSIWGANAHASVLTVGATRTDTTWLGYSSEGPGPTPRLAQYKPDLCVPSQFEDSGGEYPPNLGTSAAAGLAAGVVAAFRSKWLQTLNPVPTSVSAAPATLIATLNATAQPIHGPGWDRRFGHGMMDAFAAAAALPP